MNLLPPSLIVAAICALPLGAEPSPPAHPLRPNIIFILCDDLGYGDVGVFTQNQRAARNDRNLPSFATPSIDTLAHDGVIMTQHYAAASVCAPSRASLLTGLTQGHANVRDNQFDKALADSHTIPSVLRQAGYATAAFGKWGLQGGDDKNPVNTPATWPAYPTRRGFEFFFGYVRHKDGHFHYPKEDRRELWENDCEVSDQLDLCYTTDLFTARTKRWIIEHNAAKPAQPFFLYLAYDTPHATLQNPPAAYPTGGGLGGGVRWTGQSHTMINTATGEKDAYMHPDFAHATWDHDRNPATPEVPWPDVEKRHANGVRRIDDGVGDLLQLLKDLKIDDNTLVVFTSDNGPSDESYLKDPHNPGFFQSFGPFVGIKRDTWEGGIRVPALARWPAGIPAGRTDSQASGQWDWLATFAELAGLPPPAASDGVSLVPSLSGRGQRPTGIVYVEYFNREKTPKLPEFSPAHRGRNRGQMQVIHQAGYKGIRYDIKSADDAFEIYDLSKDPQEANNLALGGGLPELQAAMKARVLQVRKPNASAPRPYDRTPVPALVTRPANADEFTWSLYKGVWPWVPDFRTLTPATTGKSSSLELPSIASDGPFGVAYGGYFYAPADGDYEFTLVSDTGATLFLHDIRVIEDPLYGAAGEHRGGVCLAAGWHPLRLYSRHDGSATPFLTVSSHRSPTPSTSSP